jgi:hypothetical protein
MKMSRGNLHIMAETPEGAKNRMLYAMLHIVEAVHESYSSQVLWQINESRVTSGKRSGFIA